MIFLFSKKEFIHPELHLLQLLRLFEVAQAPRFRIIPSGLFE